MDKKAETGHFDNAWMQVDAAEDPGFFVRFLDASRARALHIARTNPQAAFAHLDLRPGLSVLDCGCGTGDMLAIIAEQTAPGRAIGGDISTTMLREARRRSVAGRTNLEFMPINVQALPFAEASFDRVLATQLLVHVPDPRGALHEMCNVTATSGRIAIADMDWDSLVLGCSDSALGRRFTRLFSDGIRNGLVVREYCGWLREEGFANIKVIPQPFLFDQWDFVRKWMVEPSLKHFVATGGMSAEEAAVLSEDLAERSDSGRFFAASTFYTIVGDRV